MPDTDRKPELTSKAKTEPETAVLLIDCPDRKGLVARVSGLLYGQGANILHADQHQDHELGLFFMRVEWSPDSSANAVSSTANNDVIFAFKQSFQSLASELQMRWQLHRFSHKPRVAIFCSQYLHCLADLLHRHSSGELPCEIAIIVSNHREAELLAAFYGIRFEHIPVTPTTRVDAEQQQRDLLASLQIELVILARYMQILTEDFVARYPAAIINVHHSFLPAFIGARPYHAAHTRGVKLIGATSHYVTTALDDGPIIEQDVARISHRDQVPDLIARGRDLERIVLSRAVRWHLEHRILCYGNKTVVFD
ncbi:formyltetrahydrofolate deformylase [Acidicapsa dinghuensis]|uniref:Formyltetrahydrofolate deformylase n=1 Tax=Acidicapsa dinghuensis TaxID=2218256 RepID=A0ABW1EIW2_9BACT|nr:formyltetrahydrofolate deformylase [Acidicapsa dinghuensis]